MWNLQSWSYISREQGKRLGWLGEKDGRGNVGQKVHIYNEIGINSRDLFFSMMTIVNVNKLYCWNVLREQMLSILIIKIITMWGKGLVN